MPLLASPVSKIMCYLLLARTRFCRMARTSAVILALAVAAAFAGPVSGRWRQALAAQLLSKL
jgi:hypothetical protein